LALACEHAARHDRHVDAAQKQQVAQSQRTAIAGDGQNAHAVSTRNHRRQVAGHAEIRGARWLVATSNVLSLSLVRNACRWMNARCSADGCTCACAASKRAGAANASSMVPAIASNRTRAMARAFNLHQHRAVAVAPHTISPLPFDGRFLETAQAAARVLRQLSSCGRFAAARRFNVICGARTTAVRPMFDIEFGSRRRQK
jgi:hypothetical protein